MPEVPNQPSEATDRGLQEGVFPAVSGSPEVVATPTPPEGFSGQMLEAEKPQSQAEIGAPVLAPEATAHLGEVATGLPPAQPDAGENLTVRVEPSTNVSPSGAENDSVNVVSASTESAVVDRPDHDTAHEMALSSNYDRTKAANIRRDVTAETNFKKKLYELLNDPRFLDTSTRTRIRRFFGSTRPPYAWGRQLPAETSHWAQGELETLRRESGRSSGLWGSGLGENPDIGWSDTYDAQESSRNVFNGEYDPSTPIRQDELEQARQHDERAERLEEWARLLHEKSITPEYRSAHPSFKFGAYEMIRLEDLAKTEGREPYHRKDEFLNEAEFDDPESVGFSSVLNSLDSAIEHFAIFNSDFEEDVAFFENLKKIMSAGETNLNQLVDLYKEVCKRNNDRVTARAKERLQVLDDVKSGRAFQPPEPTDSPEQQAA